MHVVRFELKVFLPFLNEFSSCLHGEFSVHLALFIFAWLFSDYQKALLMLQTMKTVKNI